MDGYSDFPSEFETPEAAQCADAPEDVTVAIGTDERRMHVRAYNYWVSLLEGRDFPSIEDLEPEDLSDFSANSVLLDFTCGRDNPAIPYIGGAIREECELDDQTRAISDVPKRSLLSRLTDHYMQIIANRAPVGFEAEFANPRGINICYRGILMPFSSDGDMIDFIYGVINWKTVEPASQAPSDEVALPLPALSSADAREHLATDPHPSALAADLAAPTQHPAIDFRGGADLQESEEIDLPEVALEEDCGLADRLCAARETAEAVKAGEGRTRAALYQALSLAYDFALASRAKPDDYAELLADSGLKAQDRAPMTPVIKLVFGIDYDKGRLTEFAAALSYADRNGVAAGGFGRFVESAGGGLKALVAAERRARRPEADPAEDRFAAACAKLAAAEALTEGDLDASGELAVMVMRRSADGRYDPVAILADDALSRRVIRKAAA